MFAKWWSLQPNIDYVIECAINARFIMNNDLSRIASSTTRLHTVSVSGVLLSPTLEHARELFRRVPSMKPAIAKTCIVADYPNVWDVTDPDPDSNLKEEARESSNPMYLRDLESKIPQRGCLEYSER